MTHFDTSYWYGSSIPSLLLSRISCASAAAINRLARRIQRCSAANHKHVKFSAAARSAVIACDAHCCNWNCRAFQKMANPSVGVIGVNYRCGPDTSFLSHCRKAG